MKTIINETRCSVHLVDEIERLKGNWGIWACSVEFEGQSEPVTGTIQTDGHSCAPESWEAD